MMMMKRLQVFAVLILMLFSCREDDEPEVSSDLCDLQSFVETYPEYNLIYTVVLEYDEAGNVISLTEQEDYEGEVYHYELHIEYSDGKIISVHYEEGGGITEYEISVSYNDDRLSELVYISRYDEQENIDKYQLFYTNDKLARIENYDNYSGDSPGEFSLYGYQ